MLSRDVLRDLERQVGTSHVYTRPADLAAYAYDAYGASGLRRIADGGRLPGLDGGGRRGRGRLRSGMASPWCPVAPAPATPAGPPPTAG